MPLQSIKELYLGTSSYFAAHKFIRQNRLRSFLIVPAVVNVLLFGLFLYFFFNVSGRFEDYLLGLLSGIDRESNWFDATRIILAIVIKIAGILLYFSIYKYIVLIILSPVLSWLAQRTLRILTGQNDSVNLLQLIKDLVRGTIISTRNIIMEGICTLGLLILSPIPVVNIFVPIGMVAVQGYFTGFSMLDYTSEAKGLRIAESFRFVRRHRVLAATNGSIFMFLLSIPVVGVLIAPPYATVAAAIAYHELTKEKKQ